MKPRIRYDWHNEGWLFSGGEIDAVAAFNAAFGRNWACGIATPKGRDPIDPITPIGLMAQPFREPKELMVSAGPYERA